MINFDKEEKIELEGIVDFHVAGKEKITSGWVMYLVALLCFFPLVLVLLIADANAGFFYNVHVKYEDGSVKRAWVSKKVLSEIEIVVKGFKVSHETN